MKELLERIYPLHRTLASDGTEQALAILGEYLPKSYRVLGFNPGDKAWDWTVPPKYVVKYAGFSDRFMPGTYCVNFQDNPLHLVSYSPPLNTVMAWEQLAPHLHVDDARPDAIPWKYAYYKNEWGFCLPKSQYDALEKLKDNTIYRVIIDSEFDMTPGAFKVGECFLMGDRPQELMVLAHICHPNQANDDAAGVAVSVEVARRLAEHPLPPGSMGVRFLYMPETIGTIVYLSHNAGRIPYIKGGIFIETPGAGGSIALQLTNGAKQDLIDRIAERAPGVDRFAAFTELAANDERVLSAPNVNIPCVSFTRSPYPEYHTSDDNLSIINWDYMEQMANTVEYTIRMYASNYVPIPLFKGPVMLSKHGLFVDWAQDWSRNRLIEGVMMAMDGEKSVFEIAEGLNADYYDVRKICELFVEKRLVNRK